MLSRKPIIIDDDNYYYEQLNGLLVVHRVRSKWGDHLKATLNSETVEKTDEIRIPWSAVIASVKRKKKLDQQWRVKKNRFKKP